MTTASNRHRRRTTPSRQPARWHRRERRPGVACRDAAIDLQLDRRSPISSRDRVILSTLDEMRRCPPKPGFPDITSTRSLLSSRRSRAVTDAHGVARHIDPHTALARAPIPAMALAHLIVPGLVELTLGVV
jgi:hypothetical protein